MNKSKTYFVEVEGELQKHEWLKYEVRAKTNDEAREKAVKLFMKETDDDWDKYSTTINGKTAFHWGIE